MKRSLLFLALACTTALAQTKTVNKTISNNGLTENLVVPSGKTLTIASGATIAAAEGSTITGFTANAVWGGITGTLSAQTDLQTALDLKLATATAASTYQPLDGDLTAIAALTTTSFGRELLTRADAAATRSALGLGTLATQSATISDYLTSSNAALTYQPLDSQLTALAGLADASGVLTNNGSGTLSYTATSTGGNAFGTDAGKIAVYGNSGEFTATSALRLTAGPTVMGVWFGSDRLAKESTTTVRTWTLPNQTGTIALRGANTFDALQQFTGTDHAGLRLNNLTTTQRDAIGTPAAGMVIWNTTAARIQAYNGSAWTAGMVRLDGDTMTGTLVLPAGTVSAPSLTFGDSTSGIYRSASGEVALTSGGTQRLRSTSSGVTVTGTLTVGSGAITDLGGGQLSLTSAGHYAFSSGFSATGLLRVSTSGNAGGNYAQWSALAAHTAIQRDAANAQAFYVANTYTSTTSYEAAGIRWSSNVAIFGPVKGSGGGSSRNAQYHTTETGVYWSSGSGSPESVVTAPVGSIYTRTDGGAATTLYIKESGTGNTGWIAK